MQYSAVLFYRKKKLVVLSMGIRRSLDGLFSGYALTVRAYSIRREMSHVYQRQAMFFMFWKKVSEGWPRHRYIYLRYQRKGIFCSSVVICDSLGCGSNKFDHSCKWEKRTVCTSQETAVGLYLLFLIFGTALHAAYTPTAINPVLERTHCR